MDTRSNLLTGIMNSSDNQRFLDAVKASVHSGMFVVIGVFTYMIAVTVLGTRHLRRNTYYRLLLQHCACLMGFNAVSSVFHSLCALRLPITRLVCWILFNLQTAMRQGVTLIFTLMCMCMCLSVCCPLHSKVLVHTLYRWGILVTWMLTVINPVVFTVLVFVQQPWHYMTTLDTECSTALEGKVSIISTLLLLFFIVLLISSCYVLICLEGYRTGHFSQSNSKGRCTLLIHILQISMHILSISIIISHVHEELIMEIITFLIFSILQFLSPVIYGLRCEELNKELPRFFPRYFNERMTLEPGVSMDQRGSTMTITITGVVSSTSTGNTVGTVHGSDRELDEKNKHHMREGHKESTV